jgi:hypothetical protein
MGRLSKHYLVTFFLILLASSITLQFNVVKATTAKEIIVPDDFSSIQSAINSAKAGDTIFVRSGNYNITTGNDNQMSGNSLFINKSISVIGQGCENTIITTTQIGPYDVGIDIAANNVTISGFTIVGNANVIVIGGSANTVTNNIINLTSSNGGNAIEDDGSEDKLFSNILNGAGYGTSGLFGNETTGILVLGNMTASNNIIRNFGVGLSISAESPLDYSIQIVNNTIDNNAVGIFLFSVPTVLYENNIMNQSNYNIYTEISNVNATYNWWGTNDSQTIANSLTKSNDVTFAPFLKASNPQAMPIASPSTPLANTSPGPSIPELFPTVVVTLAVVLLISTLTIFLIKRRSQ